MQRGSWWYDSVWWRHQMEPFSTLLALCEGKPLVTDGFPHKGQWYKALMFSLICDWTNSRDAGDLKRHRADCDVTVVDSCQGYVVIYDVPPKLMLNPNVEKYRSFKIAISIVKLFRHFAQGTTVIHWLISRIMRFMASFRKRVKRIFVIFVIIPGPGDWILQATCVNLGGVSFLLASSSNEFSRGCKFTNG